MARLLLTVIMGLAIAVCYTSFHATAAPPEVKSTDLPRSEPTPAEEAASKFAVRPGFRMELMAAEPLIADPVAVSFDEDGRAYVVEMRDYSEHREEKLGRVKLLVDENGDGKYDKATLFAEGLAWPTAVACWDGGIFLVATPELLYLKDTDGDGKADVRAYVFLGFGNQVEKLNVQALPNSLQWGPDQRLHLALGGNASKLSTFVNQVPKLVEFRGRDLSFDPRQMDLRVEPGGGQWGMTFDLEGRKYICSNSRHIQQSIFPEYALRKNNALSAAAVDIASDGPQAEVFRQSPVEPWRILRTQWRVAGVVPGPIEGGGRASGYFTSACGITIYRGDAYPQEFQGNAFISDCGSNLIHRKVLQGEIRRSAQRAADEQTREFVASPDNWFRPVALANGPDGCLWVCDMYREIVEHPWSIPEPLKQKVNLDAGNDRGRLWRIVPTDFQPAPRKKLSSASSAELVSYLEHPNGWLRDTAARLLHQRQDAAAIPSLEKLAHEAQSAVGRMTALRVLTRILPPEKIAWERLLEDRDPRVRGEALAQLGSLYGVSEIPANLQTMIHKLAADPAAEVRFRVALLLPLFPAEAKQRLLAALAHSDLASADLRLVMASSAADAAVTLWEQAVAGKSPGEQAFSRELAHVIGKRALAVEVGSVVRTLQGNPQRTAQLQALADGARQARKTIRELTSAEQLQPLAQTATTSLRQTKLSAAERIQALQLLALTGMPSDGAVIVETVSPQWTKAEGSAAIAALDRLQPPELGELFVNLWPKLPAEARAELIQTWRSRKSLVPSLLAALTAKKIPATEISATDVAALRAIAEPTQQAEVAKIFGELSSREAALANYRGVLELRGQAIAGSAIFQAKCSSCHRKQGVGTSVGPDLDAVVTAGKEKILTNMLDPSREITQGYATGIVTTAAGEVISGIIAAEANGSVTLKIPSKAPRTFSATEIEDFKRSPKSLMPEGIEAGLSPQDVANVLEFLVSTQVPVSPRLPLHQYRTAEGKIETIQTPEHWQLRRREILAKMQEIMGPLPGKEKRVPLEPIIEEEVDCGTYLRRLVTYTSEPGNRVPAYLLIPKKLLESKSKAPAILCLHPTDNNIGHKVVVGLGGKANRQYAAELAERGFVTFAPSYPLLANYQPELEKLGYVSGTMKAIWDNSRALDYLESLPFVEPRFATIGHSLGGHNSVYSAVFDERLLAVVTSCGLDSYQDYMQGNLTGWTSTRYMPRLAAYKGRAHEVPVDFDEMLAAIAPRGVSIVAPVADNNFRTESVDRLAANALPIFQLLGKPKELIVEHPNCGHDFPDDARERAYRFIEERLEKK